MTKPVYATDQEIDGTHIVVRFNVSIDDYVKLENESFQTLQEAKDRAKELNEYDDTRIKMM